MTDELMTLDVPFRGLNCQQAMAYVGVKRRTFDEQWRPRLVAMRQGACVVFDRKDLDRLFDQFKRGEPPAANDPTEKVQNGQRNERPAQKGMKKWAEKARASSLMSTTPRDGKSINANGALDFTSAALRVMEKRKAG